jgi:hypothetical protein
MEIVVNMWICWVPNIKHLINFFYIIKKKKNKKDKCKKIKCETYPNDVICGSDGKTHTNECHLNMTACMTKSSITVLHKGPCFNHLASVDTVFACNECKFGAECQITQNKNKICICRSFDCSKHSE